jgi:tRNA 2-selenouridine synthase
MGVFALSRTDSADFETLFLADAPLLDTRAPLEFAQGAFPGAVNLPLMTDDERARIGLCYKQRGQDAAIALGHELVQGKIKTERVRVWCEFANAHPSGYLYCFRGGLRSQIAQQWMREAGVDYPRLTGGYKAMRQFLLDALKKYAQRDFLIVSGQTGCAKTQLLRNHAHAIDLEGLANHRGSAFGKRLGGQPSQIDFENALAVALLKHSYAMPDMPVLLEDESRLIGRLAVPEVIRQSMLQAPLVVIEMDLEARVEHTYSNYILGNLLDWQALDGEVEGFQHFANELRHSLATLQRRLGGYRFTQLASQMDIALVLHHRGNPDGHRVWIRTLLKDYYDPMYAYQLGQKSGRVQFRGSYMEVMDYLKKYRKR